MCLDLLDVELSYSNYQDNFDFISLTVDQCKEECEEDFEKIKSFAQNFKANIYIAYNEIDFAKFDQKPIRSVQKRLKTLQLIKETTFQSEISLRENNIET